MYNPFIQDRDKLTSFSHMLLRSPSTPCFPAHFFNGLSSGTTTATRHAWETTTTTTTSVNCANDYKWLVRRLKSHNKQLFPKSKHNGGVYSSVVSAKTRRTDLWSSHVLWHVVDVFPRVRSFVRLTFLLSPCTYTWWTKGHCVYTVSTFSGAMYSP